MKRLILALCTLAAFGLAGVATAGDYHSGTTLICSDCHVAHYSQSHAYSVGGPVLGLGSAGPYDNLLRNEVNDLCLSCHNNQNFAPDVFGVNNGSGAGANRLGGALNAAPGHLANDAGYDDIDGHTLWSTATAPGGTFANTTTGLECTNCHAQHGQVPTQYRNLQTSTSASSMFYNHTLTYAVTTNDGTKDVFERAAASYSEADVDYNEPNTTASAYGAWCSSCHTNFHGAGGSTNMGGQSGGWTTVSQVPWKRHPTADVDIGHAGSATYVSSLTQFNSHTNRVKVMDSQGLWNGTAGDNTVTPTCFSCHKSHGNKNAFGLIFMSGTGTVTEEGDGGVYKDLCRQCHVQGG